MMLSEYISKSAQESQVRLPQKRSPMLLDEMGSWEVAQKDREKWLGRIEKSDGCWKMNYGITTKWGHVQISPMINGKCRTINAHRFVYYLFRGLISHRMLVLHNCPGGDNPGCVNPDHMFLGTDADNVHDCERKGRGIHPKGEAHGRSKLNSDQVEQIILMRRDGFSQIYAARKFGVTVGCVAGIMNGRNWAHIGEKFGIQKVDQAKYRTKVTLTKPLPL